jgi:hypothetical protein
MMSVMVKDLTCDFAQRENRRSGPFRDSYLLALPKCTVSIRFALLERFKIEASVSKHSSP